MATQVVTKNARLVILAVGLLTGSGISPTPAFARQIAQVPFVAPWTGGAYTNDQTGQFTGCIAFSVYTSGITMLVMIDRNAGWSLGFGQQQWNLQTGEQIPLSMTFDGQSPWSGSAAALNAHQVSVPMPTNSNLIGVFRGAYQMQVQARGQTFAFNLGGTSRLMVQLAQCIGNQLAAERGELPPKALNVAPTTTPLNPSTPARPPLQALANDSELIAARIASNLLLETKLPNARLLASQETPAALKGRGVAWTSDLGAGAVWLIPVSSASDPQQVASQLISSDAANCKGEFASGRSSELVDDKLITKAFTGCNESGGTRAYRYFILQRPGSPFVVYELAGSAASALASGDALSSRDTGFQAAAVKSAFSQ